MRIRRLAMLALLLGFLAGWPVWGQDKVQIDKIQITDQITAVKGKIILEPAGTITVSPELEVEFSGFFQDLAEELKKQAAGVNLSCQLDLVFDLRVKPKWKLTVISIVPKTGSILQYTDRFLAKDPADEKPYRENLAGLAERILTKYIKC